MQGSCHLHPLSLFSWKTVGLDTFERSGLVIELVSQILSNMFKELLFQQII